MLPVVLNGKSPTPDEISKYSSDIAPVYPSVEMIGNPDQPMFFRRNFSSGQPIKKKKRGFFCCKNKHKKGALDTSDSQNENEPRDTDVTPSLDTLANNPVNNPSGFNLFSDDYDQNMESPASPKSEFRSRRTRIPFRPDVSMSLWSIMKNAIGKDLTKLPLPVNFNEPLSMLQRLAEDYEYSNLLDSAADATNSYEQMAYVAAFTVSSYASTAVRTGKPFNPLLGETYECDRMADLGWRSICEQVSHHPPTVAQYCCGRKWMSWQEFTMSSKFKGNYIEVVPLGIAHLFFRESGNHYTWRKVTSMVHNIILGKLWIDQQGTMEIFNHTVGDKCTLNYIPNSMFRGESNRVEGVIIDKDQKPQKTIVGNWDKQIESSDILKVLGPDKFNLNNPKLLWVRNAPPPDSEKYYYFTTLACQLNEMEEDVAPTDSRRRPDQRLMENGSFEEANIQKVRLEEKQRTARKQRLAVLDAKTTNSATSSGLQDINMKDGGEPGYKPVWFTLQKDPMTGKAIHIFKGDYWSCKANKDWSRCPDLF